MEQIGLVYISFRWRLNDSIVGGDENDSLSDVVASIQKNLEKGLKMGNKRARQVALHNLQKRSELKVKCEFGGEKRVLSVPRPVVYSDLVRRLQEMYQMLINVFYTQCNGEIYIPMRSQQDLDAAVQLVDQNEHLTSLRLYLTPALSSSGGGAGGGEAAGGSSVAGYGGGHGGYHHQNSGYYSKGSPPPVRQSPSPPPGSLPAKDTYLGKGSPHSPLEGEGIFIPEPPTADQDGDLYRHRREGSMSDSVSSMDSSYVSG
ncbi:mitogen-activated protein kinase kinase kinase 3, partial [Plakobranchus ocellatus]